MRITLGLMVLLLAGCTAEAKLERDIAAVLKDPGSAKFEDVKVRGEGAARVACGAVNSRNSFGAYTGAQPFLVTGDQLYMDVPSLCCSLHMAQQLGESATQALEQCKAALPPPIPLR